MAEKYEYLFKAMHVVDELLPKIVGDTRLAVHYGSVYYKDLDKRPTDDSITGIRIGHGVTLFIETMAFLRSDLAEFGELVAATLRRVTTKEA